MTTQVTSPGHIRVVLPGSWVNVPLTDPEHTRAFAQRVVRERVGRDDRLAKARREAVTQMCELAAKARDTGAHTLALALELVPGLPFAASMVARDVDWPDGAPAEGAEAQQDLAVRLAAAFPAAEPCEIPAGPAVRQEETGVLRGSEEHMTSISVLYRVPRRDSDQLLALRFTGPDMGRPALIAQLFDAIAGSVEFTRERIGVPGN